MRITIAGRKIIKPLPRERTWPYTDFPSLWTRPHCDLCGPFRDRLMRKVGSDEFGPLWRCEGCDRED